MPDQMPKVTEHVPEIVAVHRGARRARLRLPGRGRRLLPRRAASPSTGGSRASGPTRSRSRSRTRSRRIRATSRSGRRPSRARTRAWDSPWGRGRPGWHIECSVMAERTARRRSSRSTAAGSTSSSRTTRTSSPSRARSATRSRSIWAHNGMLRFTGEKMSKSVGNIATIREVLDEWGRETLLVFFLGGHWRKPIDFSDGDDGAGGRAGRGVPQRLPRAERARRRVGCVRRGARRRLQHARRRSR